MKGKLHNTMFIAVMAEVEGDGKDGGLYSVQLPEQFIFHQSVATMEGEVDRFGFLIATKAILQRTLETVTDAIARESNAVQVVPQAEPEGGAQA